MSKQFIRIANLTAFTKQGIGKDFTGLRIQFTIDKTSESSANKSVIKVFNLNGDSRRFLEGKDMSVSLKAGYPQAIEQIFLGDIAKAISIRQSPDWLTRIECGDGEKKLTTSHIEKSWSAGTPFQAIIQQAIAGLGLSLGPQTIAVTDSALGGFSFSGKAKDLIDKLAKRFGFGWSVQDGAVQIVPDGETTLETAVVISPTTGLISNIIKTDKGIEFTNLLNSKLRPGRLISVIGTNENNGFFKCRKVVMQGDTHDGPWFSKVEAESFK